MRILILGSEGFIGSHLVSYYLKKKYNVHGCDLLEVGSQQYQYHKVSRLSPELEEVFQTNAYDACLNAAGTANVNYSMTHPVMDFESNALDTIRVLDALRRYQSSCRYLHISSAAVYGNPRKLPVHESDGLSPISVYGWHKLVAEQLCKEFTSIYDVPTAIVRPFSVYGPGLKKQIFWDLYQKSKSGQVGTEIELWGTGKESRDFIYVDSMVQALDCVLQKGSFDSEEYNIASGIETSIETVAGLFTGLLNKSLRIKFNQMVRGGDPKNWRADITKISSLGFTSDTDLRKGIHVTVKWLEGIE